MAENYKGHRIGSRKATIRREYDENGDKAAFAMAAELGLATGTVKSWIGTWKKGGVPAPKQQEKRATASPKDKYAITVGGNRRDVHVQGHPDWRGVILESGPEQSLIKWSNGNKTFVPNSWLEDD